MPTTPLDYESGTTAARSRTLVLLLIVIAALLALLLAAVLFFGMTTGTTMTATGQVTVAQPMTLLHVPSQEQMRNEPLPPEGVDVTLKQRESRWLPGGRLELSIDDITGGQVLVTVSDDAGDVLLGPKSVRGGDAIDFALPQGASFRLEVLKLTNLLTGDDFAEFRIVPLQHPATRPTLTEAQKIELLLSRIAELDAAKFVRNGSEHGAGEAVEHLRMKWERAGGTEDSTATARDFIDKVATRSSMSGKMYLIRFTDGREVPSGDWLLVQLREIERAPSDLFTRPAATRKAHGAASS